MFSVCHEVPSGLGINVFNWFKVMVGWALSDPASAAKARRATGYLLTTNLSVKWCAVAYPPTVRLRGGWKLAVLWQHWLHLIDKSPVPPFPEPVEDVDARTRGQLITDRESL